jgi:hypothetical protein
VKLRSVLWWAILLLRKPLQLTLGGLEPVSCRYLIVDGPQVLEDRGGKGIDGACSGCGRRGASTCLELRLVDLGHSELWIFGFHGLGVVYGGGGECGGFV